MTPVASDYAFAALFVLILPAYGLWEYRQLKRWIAEGLPEPRLKSYRLTMSVLWLLTITLMMVWTATARPWSVLGLELGVRWWIGVVIIVVMGGLTLKENRAILRDPKKAESMRARYEHLGDLLPSNDQEGTWWVALSMTAGVCEELLFRGFLIALVSSVLNIWWAVGISSVIFGLNHAYQGVGGIMKTAIFGLLMAGMYQLTGSLWTPIVVHALIDLNSGYLGRRLMGDQVDD